MRYGKMGCGEHAKVPFSCNVLRLLILLMLVVGTVSFCHCPGDGTIDIRFGLACLMPCVSCELLCAY